MDIKVNDISYEDAVGFNQTVWVREGLTKIVRPKQSVGISFDNKFDVPDISKLWPGRMELGTRVKDNQEYWVLSIHYGPRSPVNNKLNHRVLAIGDLGPAKEI